MTHLEVNLGVEDPLLMVGMADRYELAIDYLKSNLDGLCLENEVVSLMLSHNGFYYEFIDSPECFYGATRPSVGEVLTDEQAVNALFEAISLYRAGEGRVMVIYGNDYQMNDEHIFMGTYFGAEPIERGYPKLQVPLFFRLDVNSVEDTPLVMGKRGTAFLVRTFEGENVLLRLPNDAQNAAIMQGIRE